MCPDFEIDLGLWRRLELDLDGAFAIDPRAGSVPDHLWLSAKVGILDARLGGRLAVALGAQLGPRLPVAHGATGVGVDGLLLVGLALPRTHVVLNAGAYLDPEQAIEDGTMRRPAGVQLGLDVDVDLTADGRWSFHGAAGALAALTVDPHQLTLAAGIVFQPAPSLELSLLFLAGLLPGGDRAGVLVGASPKWILWR